MSTKNQVLAAINLYAPIFIKSLKLESCTIKWYVFHSSDPDLKTLGFNSTGCVAECMWSTKKKNFNKTYSIAIYHNLHRSNKEIVGSIFHELLHVRMRHWDRLIKVSKINRAHVIEEALVVDIEKILIDLI